MFRLPKFVLALAVCALLLSATPMMAEETKGTVRSVNNTTHVIVLKGVLKDTTVPLNQDAKIILDGKKAAVTDLRDGDQVVIVQANGLGNEVRALRNDREITGTIAILVTDRNEIVLKGTLHDTPYHLEKGARVSINSREAPLSSLREGDSVCLTYHQVGDRQMVDEVRCLRK